MMTFLAVLAGAAAVGGVLLLIVAIQPTPPQGYDRPSRLTLSRRWAQVGSRTKLLLVVGAVVGLVAAAVSGIIVLVVVIPLAGFGLPLLLRKADTRERDLLSALETWARSLASTAETGSFTLKEVIGTSRGSAPPIIRIAIDRMYSRMNGSWGNAAALRAFADEMDNAWADEVVIYLIQAAEFNAGGLTQALSSLADNLATQVKQRMVIYNERDKPRRTMATMTGIIAFVLAGIVLFSATPQLGAYSTPVGEVVLTIILSVFLLLLVWAKRQARTRPEPRIVITDAIGRKGQS
jgi:tight adherence protein B